ncbi:nuclease-sensitive element-binding protein 1, partial [Clonorchis sinensis]
MSISVAEKVRGHVKWYSVARRYGFISRNDDGGDLFVHRSVISSCSRRIPSLRSGEEVEFNVVETNHGVEANYVTGPGGQPVKGIKPVYRRFRTTSEPNMDPNSTHTPAFTPEAEHVRPRQGGRRPRGPRQSSNRVLSAGANESQKNEEGEHADNGKHEQPNGTTPHQLNEHTVVDGHSPNHTVPRQRRRPQRRTPRHRSAPTADTGDNMDDDQNGLEHDAHTPVARYDGRGHPRPFRRPFRQRGGFRYMNGYAYGQNYMVHPVGPPPYQNRFRPMGGYRDGFDQGPRRSE